MSVQTSTPSLEQLRWRCRRGMRELDMVFTRWLDSAWSSADDDQRKAFLTLLECEDDQIWRWLIGRDPLPDGALGALLESFGATRN